MRAEGLAPQKYVLGRGTDGEHMKWARHNHIYYSIIVAYDTSPRHNTLADTDWSMMAIIRVDVDRLAEALSVTGSDGSGHGWLRAEDAAPVVAELLDEVGRAQSKLFEGHGSGAMRQPPNDDVIRTARLAAITRVLTEGNFPASDAAAAWWLRVLVAYGL